MMCHFIFTSSTTTAGPRRLLNSSVLFNHWRVLLRLQGGFQYYLYNHLFVKWCAGMTAALGHKGSAPVKTFIDQAIQ
jgi:hypothetical protein